MNDLKIGAEILREALERELTKEDRITQARKEEKAAAAAQIENVGHISRYIWCALMSCITPFDTRLNANSMTIARARQYGVCKSRKRVPVHKRLDEHRCLLPLHQCPLRRCLARDAHYVTGQFL